MIAFFHGSSLAFEPSVIISSFFFPIFTSIQWNTIWPTQKEIVFDKAVLAIVIRRKGEKKESKKRYNNDFISC